MGGAPSKSGINFRRIFQRKKNMVINHIFRKSALFVDGLQRNLVQEKRVIIPNNNKQFFFIFHAMKQSLDRLYIYHKQRGIYSVSLYT